MQDMDTSYKTPTASRRYTHTHRDRTSLNKTNHTNQEKKERNKEKNSLVQKTQSNVETENRDHGPGSVRPPHNPSLRFLNGCWL